MPARRTVTLNNPALLTWARETAGYSVEDIAAVVKKTPEIVLAWESGHDAPTFGQLETFARKVRRSVAALYMPQPPPVQPLPKDFRRLPAARVGVYSPQARLCFRKLRNALRDLSEVLPLLGGPARHDLPGLSIDENPVAGAARLREQLGISVADQISWRDAGVAMDRWRDRLFDHGVLVQVFSIPLEELRGFSVLEGELAGVGLSSKDATSARAFSLFHEVAHLCLRQPGVSGDGLDGAGTEPGQDSPVERYCNRFAAAFLLPQDDPKVQVALRDLAARLDVQHLRSSASGLKVSKHALLRRVLDAGLLDADTYWQAKRQLQDWDSQHARSISGKVSPAVVHISQVGKRFVNTVIEAVDRGLLSSHHATRMLGMGIDKIGAARLPGA